MYELMPFHPVGDSQPIGFTFKFASVGGVTLSEDVQLGARMLLVDQRKRIKKIVVPSRHLLGQQCQSGKLQYLAESGSSKPRR